MSRKCCNKPSKYEIVYDCSPDPDQELTLCEYHYNLDPAFSRNIKTIKELEKWKKYSGVIFVIRKC